MGFEFLTVVPWVCTVLFAVGVSLFVYLIASGPSSQYERRHNAGSIIPKEPTPEQRPCYLTEQIHEAARAAGLCVECGERKEACENIKDIQHMNDNELKYDDDGRKYLIDEMQKRLLSIFDCAYEDQIDKAIIDLMEEKLSKMTDKESAKLSFNGVNDDGSLSFTFKIIGENEQ